MLLTGAPIKQRIKEELRLYIESTSKYQADAVTGTTISIPHLGIVMVGDNPRSRVYIEQKIKFAHSIGAVATLHEFPETITAWELCQEVEKLGANTDIHGIIIQMPLPTHFSMEDARKVIDTVPVQKDADGLTAINTGHLTTGSRDAIIPATSRGILELCQYYDIALEGKHVVVVGRSNLVGKPTALSVLERGATVTICHSKTKNLKEIMLQADIVISATGMPKLITVDMVHAGQYLIDVGITIDGAGKICGDIDTTEVEGLVAGVSPVPGGVGPLTVSGLFLNLIDLFKRQQK
jgi:methylenetetrahydrofolate dehydrogenase (NADP+)/methenyltetrahydrofolate cyclohydrolase